jgi:hypothetical protein
MSVRDAPTLSNWWMISACYKTDTGNVDTFMPRRYRAHVLRSAQNKVDYYKLHPEVVCIYSVLYLGIADS